MTGGGCCRQKQKEEAEMGGHSDKDKTRLEACFIVQKRAVAFGQGPSKSGVDGAMPF
jgi:hypothetical protein